jgi:hypothetical protein
VGGNEPTGLAGASEPARADLTAAFAAGFLHQAERDRARRDDGPDGNLAGGYLSGGFAPGGVLDQMLPGAELAAHLAAARRAGYGGLGDTETCGVIAACRRLASWAAESELSAIASLATRRAGPGEHLDAEIGALLTLTPQGAAALTGLARDLARLPQTRALLAAGIIDHDRAKIIAQRLSVLPDEDAAAVEDKVTRQAGKQTTGKLRAAVVRAVKAHDPEAAERRKDKAQEDARVEV